MNIVRGAQLEEMARFGVVGVLTNVVYFGALWLLRSLSAPWWLAASLAYALSMALNYHLQRNFTFRSLLAHQRAGGRYVVVQLGGLVINGALLELLLGQRLLDATFGYGLAASAPNLPLLPWSSLRVLVAQGISLAVTTVYSYVAQRTWVFGTSVRD